MKIKLRASDSCERGHRRSEWALGFNVKLMAGISVPVPSVDDGAIADRLGPPSESGRELQPREGFFRGSPPPRFVLTGEGSGMRWYISELIGRPLESVVAVLNWHQAYGWVDPDPKPDEPPGKDLPRRQISMEAICEKYSILPLDFLTAWDMLGILAVANPHQPLYQREKTQVFLCVGEDDRSREGPALELPVPVTTTNTFARNHRDTPSWKHVQPSRPAAMLPHAYVRYPPTNYAYGTFVNQVSPGCFGIPLGRPPRMENLDSHQPETLPGPLRWVQPPMTSVLGYGGLPDFSEKADIERPCPSSSEFIALARKTRLMVDDLLYIQPDFTGPRRQVPVGPGCPVRVEFPLSTTRRHYTWLAKTVTYGKPWRVSCRKIER